MEDDDRARASPAEGGKGEGKRKRPPPGTKVLSLLVQKYLLTGTLL